jgi:hypothetical protein
LGLLSILYKTTALPLPIVVLSFVGSDLSPKHRTEETGM